MSELEQLNSDDIKNVEVIRNPGSRYDATVKAVVRIQTVKRQGDGFGFNLRSSYYQSDNTDLIEQANFNYRHNNLDIFGSLYYNQMESWQDFILQLEERGTKVWNHDMKSYGEFYSKMLSGNIGFNYQLNDNHAFGMKYKSGKTLNPSLIVNLCIFFATQYFTIFIYISVYYKLFSILIFLNGIFLYFSRS